MGGNNDRRRRKAQRQARKATRRKAGNRGHCNSAPPAGSPAPRLQSLLREELRAKHGDPDAVETVADEGGANNLELELAVESEGVALTESSEKDRRDRLAKRAEKFFERAKSQASAAHNAAFAWLLALFVVWAGGIQPSGRRYLAKTQQQESARSELDQKREELRKLGGENTSRGAGNDASPAQESERGVKDSGVPRSKAGLDAYSRSKALQGDLVDLRKELEELQVGFKVPGVDLKIPLVVAPFVWILLMLGLIYTLAKARQRILSLTAQGTRILIEDLSTPKSDISDIVGDFPFWLAPLPVHRAPNGLKAVALRSVLGWENKSLTNSVKVLCFLAILLLWQVQVCWLSANLGKAIIEKMSIPGPVKVDRSTIVLKHDEKRHETASTDAETPPERKRVDLDLAVGSWRGESWLALLELDSLTIAVLAFTVLGILTWWPPNTVPDQYSSELTASQIRLTDLWCRLTLRRAVRTEADEEATAEGAVRRTRHSFSRRRLLGGLTAAAAAGLAVVVGLVRPGHFSESGPQAKPRARPRHLSRRKQRLVKTGLASGFHKNARTEIIHWVGAKGEIRGLGRINAAALLGVGESQPGPLEGERARPRVHLSASSHAFEEAAREQQRLGKFAEACALLLLGIQHDERLRAAAPSDVKRLVRRQRSRTKKVPTLATAVTPTQTHTPRRPSLRIYDLMAQIAAEQKLPMYLAEVVKALRAAQPAYEPDQAFYAKIGQRLTKWSDPKSVWRRRRETAIK